MNTMPPAAEMKRAYLEKDASYNGLFFLGVRTTGIFCRPTCPARKPLPKNVEYFPNAQTAVFAGYRPCKRCRPLESDGQPAWAAELLAEVERDPSPRISDADLKARGIDPATVRRYFLREYGMTFQAFTRARRLSAALGQIRDNEPLDSAVFASGFESHSGFRDAFLRTFGDTPGNYRDGECVLLSWLRSPLGPLIAGATADGICLLEFTDRRMLKAQFAVLRKRFAVPLVPGSNRHLETLEAEMAAYFAGKLRDFSGPLIYPGTDFQRRSLDAIAAHSLRRNALLRGPGDRGRRQESGAGGGPSQRAQSHRHRDPMPPRRQQERRTRRLRRRPATQAIPARPGEKISHG